MRRRGSLGEPGHPDRGGEFADPDRQPLQGHAGLVPALAQSACAGADATRSARHQGPGKRQARARDRGCRRASSARVIVLVPKSGYLEIGMKSITTARTHMDTERQPKAYSYKRFSTPAQEHGDSLR